MTTRATLDMAYAHATLANTALALRIANVTGEIGDLRSRVTKTDWLAAASPVVRLVAAGASPESLDQMDLGEFSDENGLELQVLGQVARYRLRVRLYAFHGAPALWLRADARNLMRDTRKVALQVPWLGEIAPGWTHAEGFEDFGGAFCLQRGEAGLLLAPAVGELTWPLPEAGTPWQLPASEIGPGVCSPLLSAYLVSWSGGLEQARAALEKTRKAARARESSLDARMEAAEADAQDQRSAAKRADEEE